MLLKRCRRWHHCHFGRFHADKCCRFPACGFLLVFCSNHRSKMHRFWATGMGQTDRRTDGLQHCLIPSYHSRFPLSGKSGNVRKFCFDWNVRQLSGNFAVCQGIFVVKSRLHGCVFTEIIINVYCHWHCYLSGARCRFAYGPADATDTPFVLLQ